MKKKKKKLHVLKMREKKDYLLSVKRLKLKRERHVEWGDKDYARVHPLFMTGDANIKNKKKTSERRRRRICSHD